MDIQEKSRLGNEDDEQVSTVFLVLYLAKINRI
jgi:hypothetical protein